TPSGEVPDGLEPVIHGSTNAFCRRSRTRRLLDGGTLPPIRRQSQDGLQVARPLRGGWRSRACRPLAPTALLPARNLAVRCGRDRRGAPAPSYLGRQEAPLVARE